MLHAILVAAAILGVVSSVLLAVNLATIRRLSRFRGSPSPPRRVSVVIPARNEASDVERAVRSHLASDHPDLEVIVVDDRSTDRTAEILARLARESPRLTVVAGTDPPEGWLGKPHALALGAAAARGDLLLFADADVRYDPRGIGEAVAFLESRGLDFLALLPKLEARGFWEKVLLPYVLSAYFLGPGFLANLRRPRGVAAGGGAGNLIRRTVYDAVGGHRALRRSVIDDIHLALLVKRRGYRTRAVRAEDRVFVRMYRGFREVCNGFTKNLAYAFNGLLGVFLVASTALSVVVAVVPAAVLLAGAAGLPVQAADLRLAAAGYLLPAVARIGLAAALRDPLWPAFAHPLMSLVWAGIIGRSFYHRKISRRLAWRGREFDARTAEF